MPFITSGGKLLTSGGQLTTDPRCCCGEDGCPACCLYIVDGVFNADGDLEIFAYGTSNSLKVTLIMPVKNRRYVCDGDIIEVEWSVQGSHSGDTDGYIHIGPSWIFSGPGTPAGYDETTAFGFGGNRTWTEEDAIDYTTDIAFHKCFNNTENYHGLIIVGTKDPALQVVIDGYYCGARDDCCYAEDVCEDCCFVWEKPRGMDAGGAVYWITSANGFFVVVKAEQRKYCAGDAIGLSAIFMPPVEDDYILQAYIAHGGWVRSGFSPAINGADGMVLENSIDWGSLPDRNYSVGFEYECQYDEVTGIGALPDLGLIDWSAQWSLDGINTLATTGVQISPIICDTTGCCPDLTCGCCDNDATFNVISDVSNEVFGQQSYAITMNKVGFCRWEGTVTSTITYFGPGAVPTTATITIEVWWECDSNNVLTLHAEAHWTRGTVDVTYIIDGTADMDVESCLGLSFFTEDGYQVSIQLT